MTDEVQNVLFDGIIMFMFYTAHQGKLLLKPVFLYANKWPTVPPTMQTYGPTRDPHIDKPFCEIKIKVVQTGIFS